MSPSKSSSTPATADAPPSAKRKGRADYGAPIDGYFENLTPDKRAPLEKLRSIVEATVPSAQSGLKWGAPSTRSTASCSAPWEP